MYMRIYMYTSHSSCALTAAFGSISPDARYKGPDGCLDDAEGDCGGGGGGCSSLPGATGAKPTESSPGSGTMTVNSPLFISSRALWM